MLPGGNMPAQGYILHQKSESVDMKASQFLKSYTWCAASAAIDSIPYSKTLKKEVEQGDELELDALTITKENWQTSWDSKSSASANIIRLCSFENLGNLGVKATGVYHKAISLILQCKGSRSSG
ncbi:hypothetical protein OIU84_029118 [Salix udensis]|uniref:Uncharacterized protein n=1 Tax=Salix udensis TaxID=889485 RepID=A0AAD6KAR1_9ROSI|nr:hypothetical protein OIU84_029118 [Salix udensis]